MLSVKANIHNQDKVEVVLSGLSVIGLRCPSPDIHYIIRFIND